MRVVISGLELAITRRCIFVGMRGESSSSRPIDENVSSSRTSYNGKERRARIKIKPTRAALLSRQVNFNQLPLIERLDELEINVVNAPGQSIPPNDSLNV